MVTRAQEITWIPYRDPHMLTGSLPEHIHPKSSNTARLDNNCKPLIVLLL